jgi:hypothetical protein
LSKCFWYLLTWTWVHGKAKLAAQSQAPGTLALTSGNNITKPLDIKRISPHDTFRTLGAFITPSGSSRGAFNILKEIALDYAANITGSHIARKEALMSYIQYLIPKLRFQPPALSLSKKECDQITSIALQALLPKLHINRNTSCSIIFGPQELGGLGLANLYPTQGIDKLQLYLGHIRLRDKTGALLRIDHSYIQLIIGSGTNFMNLDHNNYPWLEQGWMTTLWMFTTYAKISFIESGTWVPTISRQHDTFIMEEFLTLKLPTNIMARLNRCRIYLKVLTVSDITTADGQRILVEVKQGNQPLYRQSRLTWPTQGYPSKEDWAHWGHYLQFL